MYNVLKLNEISPKVGSILQYKDYTVSSDCAQPDAIILRSFNMHEYEVPASVKAVARAGAGVNNIPLDKMTEKNICVFNTPGANANAVKELVICALLLGSRKIVEGINWTQALNTQEDVAKAVEKGKKAFIGRELYGKTLGVVGLGAIGRLVANAAISLGMKVIGYDPYLNVNGAMSIDRHVEYVNDLSKIYTDSDYITLHVPATASTKGSINADTISTMKRDVVIINCARAELVVNKDIIDAIKSGKVSRYITDLPQNDLIGIDNVITIPHLGASTPEAEDNCAVMAASQLKDYLENGNVVNSVNFPNASAPRITKFRITVLHKNVANMIAKASSFIADRGININNLVSASRGEIGYMIIDIDEDLPNSALEEMRGVEGFLAVNKF
ncbi:MAG: 3-phosphoglycerate dehydrogenase family protein [Christensenellales bacterium]